MTRPRPTAAARRELPAERLDVDPGAVRDEMAADLDLARAGEAVLRSGRWPNGCRLTEKQREQLEGEVAGARELVERYALEYACLFGRAAADELLAQVRQPALPMEAR